MSNSLQPHGLQHSRLPCSSLFPRLCSNSSPLSRWCHLNHLILCCPCLLLPSIFSSIRVFYRELAVCIRWPKYWSFSFSISPSNEYLGLISFRVDWFDLLAVQGTLKSFPTSQFKSISSMALRLLWLWLHEMLWLVWSSLQITKTFSVSAMRLFHFHIIRVFIWVAFLVSSENISFAFTTWLTVWHKRLSFWSVSAFQVPSSLNFIIPGF